MTRASIGALVATVSIALGLTACGGQTPAQRLQQARSMAATAHLTTEIWMQHAAPTHFAVHALRATSGEAHQQQRQLAKQKGADTLLVHLFATLGAQSTSLAAAVERRDDAGVRRALASLEASQERIAALLQANQTTQ